MAFNSARGDAERCEKEEMRGGLGWWGESCSGKMGGGQINRN